MRSIQLTVALIAAFGAASDAGAASNPAFDDAVAYWSMSDRSDGAGEDSRLEVTGDEAAFGVTLDGAARASSLAIGGDGVAVRLSNASLSVGQGASGEINLEGDALSIAMRLKNTSGDWDVTLFSKHGGHDVLQFNIFCFAMPGGDLDLGFEVGTTTGFAKAPAIIPASEASEWLDIVATYDGARVALFVNGELRGSAPLTGRLRPASDTPLIIGGEPSDGRVTRRFTGLMDHVALWDRRLTEDEILSLSAAEVGRPLYGERYRPRLRFSPERNWLNDPNGMMYVDGVYHLFYQYNPYGDVWGHMSWGHAVSEDLLQWRHEPVALLEEDGVMIFSGSAVKDEGDTSGFGVDGQDPLVAIYTGHESDPLLQTQCLAYSNDGGTTWTKYADNPVIDLGMADFRDPKVIRQSPTDRWIMIVALAREQKVHFYASDDLRDWEFLSEFGPAGATGVPNWECPELFELPVDGDQNDTRWVLQIDVGDNAVSGGSGAQYFVGDFDGTRFVNENPDSLTLWVDHGRDFYAAQAFNDAPGRVVWLAWMNNWRYANVLPTHPWRGQMSLPREVGLTRTAEGVRLIQQPVREIADLRRETMRLSDVTLIPGVDPLDMHDVGGVALEIVAEFEVRSGSRFGFRVREGDGEFTTIGYDPRLREMFVDRRRSGRTDFHDDFAGFHAAPLEFDDDGTLRMRIIVDACSVEVFGGRGEAVITDLIFPSPSSTGVSLFTERGEVGLRSLEIHTLDGVWTD